MAGLVRPPIMQYCAFTMKREFGDASNSQTFVVQTNTADLRRKARIQSSNQVKRSIDCVKAFDDIKHVVRFGL